MKYVPFIALLAFTTSSAAEPSLYWVNSGLNNRDLTISPDGTELFTTLMAPANQFSVIVTSHKVDGEWQSLQVAPFSGEHPDIEPMFSPDGKRLYFASRRPRDGSDRRDWDIWYSTRSGDGWSEPVNVGPPVNSDANEFYPSLSMSGNLYFTVEREGGEGAEDIWRAVADDERDRFVRLENVGPGVNTRAYEFNAFVTPDERYIIYSAQGRDGERGGGDLYVSHRKDDGEFGPGELLEGGINSPQLDYCPFVWRDTLYFTSRKQRGIEPLRNLSEILGAFHSPQNGLGDIYAVAVETIPQLTDR